MILVTGANGMIGSFLVKALLEKGYSVIGIGRKDTSSSHQNYIYIKMDLSDKTLLSQIYDSYHITTTIHLAALAHEKEGSDLSNDAYYQANVVNAKNIFECCLNSKLLYISTVDVYGFVKGTVNSKTPLNPVTIYGKTKAEAERILMNGWGGGYDIFRFSPVFTQEIKRDIQKRYYLKYPNWAYIIGKGSKFEVLDIKNAIATMVAWVEKDECTQSVRIIKDKKMLDTKKMLEIERREGRAKHILRFPHWFISIGYTVLLITGKNKYTFLLNKAVHPLRSE